MEEGKVSQIVPMSLQDQLEKWPDRPFILFIAQNPILRKGFVIDAYDIQKHSVTGYLDANVVVCFPREYMWEVVSRSLLTTSAFDMKEFIQEQIKEQREKKEVVDDGHGNYV